MLYNNAEACFVCSLLVLENEVESRLNLCRPKDTSSLVGVHLVPMGLLMELCVRPRREYFTAVGLVPLSDPPPLWPQEKQQFRTNLLLPLSSMRPLHYKN